jgi:hypothetical protein
MRFDDNDRPQHMGSATNTALQVNGSPLPVITLLRPMQSEQEDGSDVWGWLACIHAHKQRNSFGTYYGWIRDLGQFSADYLASPEDALRRYFKYEGPEITPTANGVRPLTQQIDEDIFGTGDV